MSSPYRRRRSTISRMSYGAAATLSSQNQQYVWIETDLVEAVLQTGKFPENWKSTKRQRGGDEWGWCRARVVSSTSVAPQSSSENDENDNHKNTPYGGVTLRKRPPPSKNGKSDASMTSSSPWKGSPKRDDNVSKNVSMTITIDDADFAPDQLKGITISFSYNTSKYQLCRSNDWWKDSQVPTDLTALEQLHEPAVVYCLFRRYEEDQIYTYTGKILLALNPFRPVDVYGEEFMKLYWERWNDNNSTTRPPPHIYAIAEDAYHNAVESLKDHRAVENQSVLVSGESGAGKTVTTKIILQYLAISSQRADPEISAVGIESQVLESNPILESFGNARTVRNDNSSRFGKFMEMEFERTGCLVSASIETYLLEKVRLISQAPGERNFHVFYELLAGLPRQERQRLHMLNRGPRDFCMTSVSGTYDRRDGVQDRDTYEELRNALDTVGFTREEQMDLFTVTCALLYTSNLTFIEESEDASVLDGSNPALQFAVDLLGVDVNDLNDALCTHAIEARGETLYKHLSVDRAEKAVEALIKTTYEAMFKFIVQKINSFITVRRDRNGTVSTTASIGVLDIFGFESFAVNSFEQLCINYCNEALQQQFNRFIFKLEQHEYQREGIDWSFISFPDNQDVLDLIEKRHDGILSVLDEQSRLPRCTDATFASAIYQKCAEHPRFKVTKAMQAQLSFAVIHYAGEVEYDTEMFLEKNKDELPKETTELLISSTYPFLAQLGQQLTDESASNAAAQPTPRGATKGRRQLHRATSSLLRDSVGTQFSSQLKILRARIQSTSPHYVRCLKPNDDLVPHNFNALVIADQLRCAGVLEAIRVSRVGFPNRYYHDHFVQRYGLLDRTALSQQEQHCDHTELCGVLVELLAPKVMNVQGEGAEQDHSVASAGHNEGSVFLGIQMGKSKVFIRRKAYEALEYLRSKKLEDSAICIQSAARMFNQRNDYKLTLYAVVLMQKFVRQIGAYRLLRTMKIENSIFVIQRSLRCFKARRRLQAARRIALWCQSACRGATARQYCAYLFLDQKAACIQRAWNNHDFTRTFRRLRSAVTAIQNRHRSRKAFRELCGLRREARDLSKIAAERDKFKEESARLRKELESVKSSPEPVKPEPTPRQTDETETLRAEVQRLREELNKALQLTSPTKSVDEQAKALSKELAWRESELKELRHEVETLKSRDGQSSIRSFTIDTSLKDVSALGSVAASAASAHTSPRPKSSPARSDVSLLDDEIEEDLPSAATATRYEPSKDELQQLHSAIRQKSWRHVEQVLQHTTEICVLINQGDKYGRTAMHLVVISLDASMAEKLIKKGAVVNAQDNDGETPLHLAETAKMTELLLTEGKANPNIPNVDGICALHLAVQRRDIDSVRALVMHNANVNNADNIRWFTPLHLIALPARKEVDDSADEDIRCRIAHLLTGVYGQNHPDLNYQDSEGNSPLHYAVQLDSGDACDLVNIFLEKGANPNLKNMRDQAPLHLLLHNDALRKRNRFHEMIQALLAHGANPSAQSLTGCTPVHLSLYHKDIDSAVQLVRGGADLHFVWKKPKRWPAFWKEIESTGVLALDMVENKNDLQRIIAAITTPQKIAPTRTRCMQCKTTLRSFSRAVHCRHCGRLTCGKCCTSCLPAEFFPKSFDIKEPSWACVICEKLLTSQKEVMSTVTHPTSSYGEDEEDRYSC